MRNILENRRDEHIANIAKLFDGLSERNQFWKKKNYYYRQEIDRFYKDMIPEGKDILEIGSGDGNLLYKLKPKNGVGIDVSANMVDVAKKQYPDLRFLNLKIEDHDIDGDFDYVIISNLLEYVFDIYDFFDKLSMNISSKTKIVITGVNPLWEPIMKIATRLKLRTPVQMKNFVTLKDVENMLNISGNEVIETGFRMFFPVRIPFISYFLNKLIPRVPLLKNLCLIQYIIARPKQRTEINKDLSCTVIIPCHNEEGNIKSCIERTPRLCDNMEILLVDDGSTDNTKEIVEEMQKGRDDITLVSYMPNKGKGHAVKVGFDVGKGDILIILDADMAVLPEEMKKFYNTLASNQAEFVNGSRMIYNMAPGAMKFLNYLGNKFFGSILSFIMGQRNTDTLCGTKAFFKKDYINFRMGKCPWGDFDLLFEAARMKLKTVEMPVHYYPRVEGESKMKAFRHGAILLKMCWYGFWYLG